MNPETREAILRRMMQALVSQQVEVRVLSQAGKVVARRRFTPHQFVQAHGWMAAWSSGAEPKAHNQRHHVYLIPHGHLNWVLIDDLSEGMLQLMRDDGVNPTVVVRTNPHTSNNLQAWVCIGRDLPRDVHLEACRLLAHRYGADIGAAKPEQMGRVPCVYNAKPQHWIEGEPPPLVKLRFADGKGVQFAFSVRDEAREIAATEREGRAVVAERLRQSAASNAKMPPDMLEPLEVVQDGAVVASFSPVHDPLMLWKKWPVRRVFKADGKVDRSATDARKAVTMLRTGVPLELVHAAMLSGSDKALERATVADDAGAVGYVESALRSALSVAVDGWQRAREPLPNGRHLKASGTVKSAPVAG